jgi:hypothetical protein
LTVFPFTLRLRRNCGSCPGSLGLAQWQVGFPQRRTLAVMEPRRKSLKLTNCCRSLARSASSSTRDSGIRDSGSLGLLGYLRVTILSELWPQKRKATIHYSYVAHPFEPFEPCCCCISGDESRIEALFSGSPQMHVRLSRANVLILVASTAWSALAQQSSQTGAPTSDRDKAGLRGSVKTRLEEDTFSRPDGSNCSQPQRSTHPMAGFWKSERKTRTVRNG